VRVEIRGKARYTIHSVHTVCVHGPWTRVRILTRKPSIKVAVALITLVTFLADRSKFSAGRIASIALPAQRIAVLNSGLFSGRGRPSKQLVSCYFLLWPWTLTYDLDLRMWPRECQDEPACHFVISCRQTTFRLKVIVRTYTQLDRLLCLDH